MKLSEFSQDRQLGELLPAVGSALGAPATPGAPTTGQPGAAPAAGVKPDPKALAMAVMQAKERRDNINQQMKDITQQIQDLTKQKAELQKELATIK